MKISVRFRGPIVTRMTKPVFDITIEDGSTLERVLRFLVDTDKDVREIWQSHIKMDREALILRNDVDVGLTGGLTTILEDGDEIVVLPLVHGG